MLVGGIEQSVADTRLWDDPLGAEEEPARAAARRAEHVADGQPPARAGGCAPGGGLYLGLRRGVGVVVFSFETDSSDLVQGINSLTADPLKPFPQHQPERFAAILDETAGFV